MVRRTIIAAPVWKLLKLKLSIILLMNQYFINKLKPKTVASDEF